jgi:hypothetical protein
VALIVAFTIRDAGQIGPSSSDGFLLPERHLISGTTSPEQKAPPVIALSRLSDQVVASRPQAFAPSLLSDASLSYRHTLISSFGGFHTLCPRPNSGESTRGPPRGSLYFLSVA